MKKKDRLLQIINLWRLVPGYLCIQIAKKDSRNLIFDELWHWNKCAKICEDKAFDVFSILLLRNKEYRSLLQYRIGHGGGGVQSYFESNVSRYGDIIY